MVEDMREGRATTERREEGDLRREDEDEARERRNMGMGTKLGGEGCLEREEGRGKEQERVEEGGRMASFVFLTSRFFFSIGIEGWAFVVRRREKSFGFDEGSIGNLREVYITGAVESISTALEAKRGEEQRTRRKRERRVFLCSSSSSFPSFRLSLNWTRSSRWLILLFALVSNILGFSSFPNLRQFFPFNLGFLFFFLFFSSEGMSPLVVGT